MPYITREDGERFIIPSYRDILSAKKPSLLKKEILLLSQSYGAYITLQKKSVNQYEVAFSPDSGYLLGECVWNYFKRPYDMIYCEAIANTNEAILVIVKAGSVYLDGAFPVDSIPEELVIFKTQQNNFSIYISGDVPISEKEEEGKFSFDASSIRSFQILDKPVFPTLPIVKAFQLQLVETVLKSQGIGVLPVKQIAIVAVLIAVGWGAYEFLTSKKEEISVPVVSFVAPSNPFAVYESELESPDPASDIDTLTNNIDFLYTIPGWLPDTVDYTPGIPSTTRAHLLSSGARMNILFDWAAKYNEKIDILPSGIFVTLSNYVARRNMPTTINKIQDIIASLIDRLSYVVPGNSMTYTSPVDKRNYSEAKITINFVDMSTYTFDLIGKTIQGMPLVITSIQIKLATTGLSGTISLKALGN